MLEVVKGWSQEDTRTLFITIFGGLAANLATVLLVGGAIALVHQGTRTSFQKFIVGLIFPAGSLVLMAIGSILKPRRRYGPTQRKAPDARYMIGWWIFGIGSLLLLEVLLLLVGLASGVK